MGGTAYLIEITSLYVLVDSLGFSPLKAVAISFWIGFVVAFTLQKLVTFKNYERQKEEIAKQLIMYGVLVGWNYGFTLVVVKLFGSHASIIVVRTLVIIMVTSWNFLLYHLIFKVPSQPADDRGDL